MKRKMVVEPEGRAVALSNYGEHSIDGLCITGTCIMATFIDDTLSMVQIDVYQYIQEDGYLYGER